MTPLVLVAALLPPTIVEHEVQVLETNTVLNADGSVRFVQVWLLDDDGNGGMVNRGYKVVQEGYPAVHVYGDHFRVVWWSCAEKVYVIRSRTALFTRTPYDREAKWREAGLPFRPTW